MADATDPGEPPAPDAAGGHRRDARLVAAGMLAVLLGWFAVGNRQDVRVHFWVVSATAPVIAGVFGAALSAIAVRRSVGRRHRREL